MKARTYYIFSLLIVFILAFSCLVFYRYSTRKGMLGSYVFSDVIPNMDKLRFITIETEDANINLELKDNLWRVTNSDGYYANYILLNSLFADIYSSRYSSIIIDSKEDNFKRKKVLSFYNENKKLIDRITIGSKDDKNLYTFARRDKETFLITGKLVLPIDIMSWLQIPSFNLYEEDIMDFYTYDKKGDKVNINISETPFMIRDYLGFIYFEDAVLEDNFDKTGIGEERKYRVVSYDGLVIDFTVIPKYDKFWGKMNISMTKMPTTEVKKFVENNAFLYEGWYFELPYEYAGTVYKFLDM